MQEEIENRTVNLAISTTKLTARTLLNAYHTWKRHHNAAKDKNAMEKPVGKQTIKELLGQNQGVSSIPIQNTGIRDFEQIARKYGIDYAITKDTTVVPPKYMIFFKARDADAMTAAFAEYSNRKLKTKVKPSVLKQLEKLKALAASIPEKIKEKLQEHGSR